MTAWIAMDEDGTIYLHEDLPYKSDYGNYWENDYNKIEIRKTDLPEGINPKWSDKEPIEVELKLEKI